MKRFCPNCRNPILDSRKGRGIPIYLSAQSAALSWFEAIELDDFASFGGKP